MKKFLCSIYNTNLFKSIDINTSKCFTDQDFKTKVSHFLDLNENQFSFQNPPKKEQLNDINKEYKLYINIHNPSPNILFQFENNDQVLLKNCATKDFYGIIKQFGEYGIYFSDFCIHNSLRITVWGIEIPQKNFQFSCIPEGTIVHVENTIPLNYKHLKFVFGVNENVQEADNFIKSKLNGCDLCGIHSAIDFKFIPYSKKLNKEWKYCILTKHLFFFESNFRLIRQSFDHFSTVLEIKVIFSQALCDNKELTPDNIIVLDQQNKKANDKCFLIDILNNKNRIKFKIQYDKNQDNQFEDINQHNEHFKQNYINKNNHFQQNYIYKDDHFQQKIKKDENYNASPVAKKSPNSNRYIVIKFIFEQNSEMMFKKSFTMATKMSEIAKYVTETYQINDKIEIKYQEGKTKIAIDREMTIDDVCDEMKQENYNGKIENILYIGICQQNKQQRDEKVKNKSIKNDNDEINQKEMKKQKDKKRIVDNDNDDDDKKHMKSLIKDENIKYKQKKFDNDIEDSDDNKKSPVKKEDKKHKYKKQSSDDDDDDDFDDNKKSPIKEENIKYKKRIVDDDKIHMKSLIKNEIIKYKKKKFENDNDDSDNNKKSPVKKEDKKHKYKKRSSDDDDDDDDFDDNKKSPIKEENIKYKKRIDDDKIHMKSLIKNEIIKYKKKKFENDNDDSDNNKKSPVKKEDKKHKYKKRSSDDDDDDDDKAPIRSQNKEGQKSKYKEHHSDDDDDDKAPIRTPNKEGQKYKYKDHLDDDDDEKHKRLPSKIKEENQKSKPKKTVSDDDDDEGVCKYFYQTNNDSKVHELILNSDAKVITMKKAIAKENSINNLANIKILFAGKDLLDDIVLKSLKIGSIILFVYIRSQEDILLMTANALRISKILI